MLSASMGWGVQSSETSAVPTNSSSRTAPIWKPTWREARARKVFMPSRSCAYSWPGVEQRVGEVHDEIDRQHQDREQDDHVLDHDQVAVVDRIVDQLADAGQAEHA